MLLNEIKKKASNFLQDKCLKTARLALTDVTEAELLAEEATNSDPWGPDAKTMTRLSEAAQDIDDYKRIVDVLHKRFCTVDWKEWRQPYKTLALLEFLLTHGPEDMFEEFHCDVSIIRDLGDFIHIDETGFDWGACMRSRSKRILRLLSDEEELKDAREKALRISREIKGFGNLIVSPSSSPSSSSSRTSISSSFGSYSCDSPTWSRVDETNNVEEHYRSSDALYGNLHKRSPRNNNETSLDKEMGGKHLWETPIEESSSLLDSIKEENKERLDVWSPRQYLRIFGTNPRAPKDAKRFRSLSDVGKKGKKIDRQSSLGH
ncbi:epsin-3 isoform X1 [Canna indica]|uniref:Epsin-3 isoform X1 n=1 Tax=Canna indica TaxID=4628 RepID=A0AAQ3QRN5_9LILI|nr:epsin-3 isoform X1 [Canna indica]